MAFDVIITDFGAAALAAAATGGPAVELSEMAFGDGNGATYVPVTGQLALVNEVYRTPLMSLAVHPDHPEWLVAEGVIPAAAGGWTVREAGIFDAAGNLFAVGAYPPAYKPLPDEGTACELLVRMILVVGSVDLVELVIDPSVVSASVEYVESAIAAALAAARRPAFRFYHTGF